MSVRQQNYWSESGGWDGQKVGKRGGQMDGQPGGQEIGYGMVDGVGSMLCPPERFKCCWVKIKTRYECRNALKKSKDD